MLDKSAQHKMIAVSRPDSVLRVLWDQFQVHGQGECRKNIILYNLSSLALSLCGHAFSLDQINIITASEQLY
jgi:hypothetical protein